MSSKIMLNKDILWRLTGVQSFATEKSGIEKNRILNLKKA